MVQIPKLREWRKARALTQVELAKLAEISARSVAGYEAGAGARPPTVRKLAEALNVEIADLIEEADYPKGGAPESPRQWLRAHDALLLSLTEEGLAVQFAALYPNESVKFADRINREWRAVEMARDLAPDPNAEIVNEAYAHAQSRYLQGRTLAPIANSYDPDNPEQQEQIAIPFEEPETPTRSGPAERWGADTGMRL
jgi:transcriptional regulator with XRE-family HTH domain